MADRETNAGETPVVKKTMLPWIVFIAALLAWPFVWGMEALHKGDLVKSRSLINGVCYSALGAGFLGCVIAPFLATLGLKRKIVYSFLAVVAFAVSCVVSTLLFLAIFHAPKE